MADVNDKSVVPKIDFTIYTNEKGETFKTTERVIKGNNNKEKIILKSL